MTCPTSNWLAAYGRSGRSGCPLNAIPRPISAHGGSPVGRSLWTPILVTAFIDVEGGLAAMATPR